MESEEVSDLWYAVKEQRPVSLARKSTTLIWIPDIDTEITRQAIEMIQGDASLKDKNSTVLYHPEWHKGVIGIGSFQVTG